MKYPLLALTGIFFMISGCHMFTAWQSIPPPGGCDQCHSLSISANWQLNYQVANVADERGRLNFQTPEYNQSISGGQVQPMESKKVEELACFDCHKAPTQSHKERKGRFHH